MSPRTILFSCVLIGGFGLAGAVAADANITPIASGQLGSMFQSDAVLHYSDAGEIVEKPYEQFFKGGRWSMVGLRPQRRGQYRIDADKLCVTPANGAEACRQVGRDAQGRLFVRAAGGLPGWLGVQIAPATP